MRFVAFVYKKTPLHKNLEKIAVAVLESAELWDEIFPQAEVQALDRRLGGR